MHHILRPPNKQMWFNHSQINSVDSRSWRLDDVQSLTWMSCILLLCFTLYTPLTLNISLRVPLIHNIYDIFVPLFQVQCFGFEARGIWMREWIIAVFVYEGFYWSVAAAYSSFRASRRHWWAHALLLMLFSSVHLLHDPLAVLPKHPSILSLSSKGYPKMKYCQFLLTLMSVLFNIFVFQKTFFSWIFK